MLQDLRSRYYMPGVSFTPWPRLASEGETSWFLKQLYSGKNGFESDFEDLSKASPIIASMNGYLSHELHRCIEVKGKYVLLVRWKSLEAHTGSENLRSIRRWKKLLHDFMPIPRG